MTPRHHISGMGTANIQGSCSGLTAMDAMGNCTFKQYCAEAPLWDPFGWLCLGQDVQNVGGSVVVAASGAPALPGPTVVPGTGAPQVPANYNATAGTCTDTSGSPAPCSTNTPAATIQYATPDPQAVCTAAGYTYDPATGACTQPATNWALYGVIGVATIVLIMRMSK